MCTSRVGGTDHAMTASAFTSVSLDPLLVLVCVDKEARFRDAVLEALLEKVEIPLPDVPRSKRVEIYVLSPAKAMRELALEKPPVRAVCSDRLAQLTPKEVSASRTDLPEITTGITLATGVLP